MSPEIPIVTFVARGDASAERVLRACRKRVAGRPMSPDDQLDEMIADSFPASDAPSSWARETPREPRTLEAPDPPQEIVVHTPPHAVMIVRGAPAESPAEGRRRVRPSVDAR